MADDNTARDGVAEVLEQIAAEGPEGFAHPRALDAALDAIFSIIDQHYEPKA